MKTTWYSNIIMAEKVLLHCTCTVNAFDDRILTTRDILIKLKNILLEKSVIIHQARDHSQTTLTGF